MSVEKSLSVLTRANGLAKPISYRWVEPVVILFGFPIPFVVMPLRSRYARACDVKSVRSPRGPLLIIIALSNSSNVVGMR